MNFKRASKKALKGYASLKVFGGLTKWAALAAAGFGAFRFFQGRRGAAA
jgi:hypothetical protein